MDEVKEEAVGFEVTEEIQPEDMSSVVEQKSLVPVTQRVKVRIAKAAVQVAKSTELKGLNIELRIVDGIEILDTVTGMTELKYVNKPMFTSLMDLCVWAAEHKADPAVNPKSHNWYKTKQYMVEFKKFLIALGYDIKTPPLINDEWLASIIGQEVLVDVLQQQDTALDAATGERKKLGTFSQRLKNWKSVDQA